MMQHRKSIASAAVALLVLSGTGGVAAAAEQPVPPSDGAIVAETPYMTIRESGEWVMFQYSEKLPDPERRTYHGQESEEQCTYTGSRTVDPSDGTVSVEREISHNAALCIMVTEVSSIPRDRMDWDDGQQESGAQDIAATPRADRTTHGAERLAVRSAWHRTRYVDPPGLTVTRVTANVTWDYNGSCVTNSWGHTADSYWLAATGWNRASGYATSSRTCSAATTNGFGYFGNSTFCVGQPTTTTWFNPNTLRGNPTGTYTVDWSTGKAGGCSSWLSFQSHAGP